MLPANLAKTRTAGRGTYGELVVFSGGPAGAGPAGVGPTSSAAAATAAAATHHPQHPHHSATAVSSSAAAAAAARELISAPLRYAPYPLPASALAANQQAQAAAAAAAAVAATTHILPGAPSLIQYANGQSLLADLTYKRLLAANAAANAAAAASMRPHHAQMVHNQPRATATLTYPIGDLLSAQGLDLSALYPLQAAALGL